MGGLRPLRVLEVGERLGTAAAGLFLAALGAEVAQVHLPTRRVPVPETTYYDRGRVLIDPGAPTAAMKGLADGADVVLTDLAEEALSELGLPAGPSDLAGGPDAQVLVSIRSLGRTGPNAGFRMTELTEWAAGGLATVTRRPHPDDLEAFVPVVPPGYQPQALAGLAAASGAFAAHRWALARREPVLVDVSVQEVQAAALHGIFPNFVWNGHVIGHPSTPSNVPGLLLPALDGDVYIRTVEDHQWEKLMDWMGEPEWGQALGALAADRLANTIAINALVSEWTAPQRRGDLMVEGQRRKVPIALPRSLDDVLQWQHLRARGLWRTVTHDGVPAEVPRVPMIEPDGWTPTRPVDGAELAARWNRR